MARSPVWKVASLLVFAALALFVFEFSGIGADLHQTKCRFDGPSAAACTLVNGGWSPVRVCGYILVKNEQGAIRQSDVLCGRVQAHGKTDTRATFPEPLSRFCGATFNGTWVPGGCAMTVELKSSVF